ncbi:hypothetical protein [Microcoleus anatoxicus]|uniref:hypothetical protein n=1 Tax=Microcoleus anatoxicus TaxID=2705319 RepID=UPI0030C8F9C8
MYRITAGTAVIKASTLDGVFASVFGSATSGVILQVKLFCSPNPLNVASFTWFS